MELFEAIKTRRSVRHFTAAPVEDTKIEAILEAGRWAPSWKNTQCWRFIVVRDADLKNKLAGTITPLLNKDNVPGPNRAAEAIRQAPVLLVACAELGRSGRNGNAYATDKGDWYMFDVALAMENMVLAAHALGLGTVHAGLLDAKKAAAILGVPKGFCVVEMTPLGYPDPAREIKPTLRKPLAEIVYREGWGNK